MRRHVGGMPLLTDVILAMRTDPLALIRGATEFVTVIYGPAVTFAFPDVKVEAYRRSVLHLNLMSAVDSSFDWRFDEAWAKLDLAPMRMRGRAELPEASLILTSVKPELTVGGTLQTRTLLAPFGYEEVKTVYGEEKDQSAGRLVMPKFPEGTGREEQGPSNSKEESEGDDGQGESRRSEEPIQQEPDQAENEDDKASTGGVSSLNFNFLSDFESGADALETTEPADEDTSTLDSPSAFMGTNRNLPESGSPSNSKDKEQRLLMESPRRRRIEGAGEVPFLGTLSEEELEVHHRKH